MTNLGEIVRQLLSHTEGATPEQAQHLKEILTPNPNAAPLDAAEVISALRAGREEALAALLARLTSVRVAQLLGGGDEARAHTAAVLNAPFPPRKAQSREFIDSHTARIAALEECVLLLATALVEVLFPSPRESSSSCHTTAKRRS